MCRSVMKTFCRASRETQLMECSAAESRWLWACRPKALRKKLSSAVSGELGSRSELWEFHPKNPRSSPKNTRMSFRKCGFDQYKLEPGPPKHENLSCNHVRMIGIDGPEIKLLKREGLWRLWCDNEILTGHQCWGYVITWKQPKSWEIHCQEWILKQSKIRDWNAKLAILASKNWELTNKQTLGFHWQESSSWIKTSIPGRKYHHSQFVCAIHLYLPLAYHSPTFTYLLGPTIHRIPQTFPVSLSRLVIASRRVIFRLPVGVFFTPDLSRECGKFAATPGGKKTQKSLGQWGKPNHASEAIV